MISSRIQNIIFDLGGVIIHLDTHRTLQALAQIGNISEQEVEALYSQSPLFKAYERGEVSNSIFLLGLRQLLNTDVPDQALIDAWNAMLLHIPAENLQVLKSVGEKYRIFLLSNTNVIHIDEVHRRLEQLSGKPNFSSYFEKVYYSQDIGARKPEPEAFRIILDDWDLDPKETLFIDDNVSNFPGAEELGIQTMHFPVNGNLPLIFAHGSKEV